MPISFRCPQGHSLSAPEAYAGRAVRCPKCGELGCVPPVADTAPQVARTQSKQVQASQPLPQRTPTSGGSRAASTIAANNGSRTSEAATVAQPAAKAGGNLAAPKPATSLKPTAEPKPRTAPQAAAGHAVTPAKAPGSVPEAKRAGPPPIPKLPTKPAAQAVAEEFVPTVAPTAAMIAPAAVSAAAAAPKSAPAKVEKPAAVAPRAKPAVERPATEMPVVEKPALIIPAPTLVAEPTLAPLAITTNRVDAAASPPERIVEPLAARTEPVPAKPAAVKPAVRLGYRADAAKRQNVYWLALGLFLLCLLHAAPATQHSSIGLSPAWAQVVWWLVLVELAYVAWMVLVPDWSTVWVAMIVFSVVSALYGAALALVVMTPRGAPILLELDEKRDAARMWCGAVILLTGLLTYAAGHVAYRWRKTYQLGR